MEINKIGYKDTYELIKGSERPFKSFEDVLKEAFEKANQYQKDYSALIIEQIKGEDIDLHDLVIAGEKAQLTLELAVQVRNKALEAYQEIMRMQV